MVAGLAAIHDCRVSETATELLRETGGMNAFGLGPLNGRSQK